MGLVVAKVGGSLFDLPDLRDRLRAWAEKVDTSVVLVPGGGDAADVVRNLDRIHRLGDENAHWIALRVLSVNAHFLGDMLAAPVIPTAGEPGSPVAVLDPLSFCRSDEGRPGALPHSWRVTSDAIAARVAERSGARLVLLKSTDLPRNMTWESAAAAGLVDETFPTVVNRSAVSVEWVNLRSPDSPRR